jgi:hypothetical protein
MCALFTLLLFGPRALIFFWWLFDMTRWERAFDTWIWPLLGFIFLPWVTLTYVIVAPYGNVSGIDWLWLGLAFFLDLATTFGGGYSNRNRVPGYS